MSSVRASNTTTDLLIQQMVSSITELDGRKAIENALQWLRDECNCKGALFCQFKGSQLLTLVTSNVDPGWGEAYRRSRLMVDDPIVRSYRNQLGFLDWQEAMRQFPVSPAFGAALQRYQLMPAFSYGYTSHCRGMSGVKSICTLSGMQRSLGNDDKYLLTSLVPVLHMVGRGARLRAQGLTERELEVLQWVRNGKTAWEIAKIRDVSEATVKYHLKAIYGKLGVANRAQAVGEALCRGLIH